MTNLTDLEATRLCAEAMGYTKVSMHRGGLPLFTHETGLYYPLHDPAQAFALVEKIGMTVSKDPDGNWHAMDQLCNHRATDTDLKRAIVLCAARAHLARKGE